MSLSAICVSGIFKGERKGMSLDKSHGEGELLSVIAHLPCKTSSNSAEKKHLVSADMLLKAQTKYRDSGQ